MTMCLHSCISSSPCDNTLQMSWRYQSSNCSFEEVFTSGPQQKFTESEVREMKDKKGEPDGKCSVNETENQPEL